MIVHNMQYCRYNLILGRILKKRLPCSDSLNVHNAQSYTFRTLNIDNNYLLYVFGQSKYHTNKKTQKILSTNLNS